MLQNTLTYKKNIPKKLSFNNVLKLPYLKAIFIRNSEKIHLISNGKLYSFKLKLNTDKIPIECSFDEITNTNQYKILTSLRFKTKNGSLYTFDDRGFHIKLIMKHSKINVLEVNGFLVDTTTLRVNSASGKLKIRKGLTFEDVMALQNKESMTNKEFIKLMETIK